MGITLDPRQRAMLAEMKVPVWLPVPVVTPTSESEPAPTTRVQVASVVAAPSAPLPASAPAPARRPSVPVVPASPAPLAGVEAMDWTALAKAVRACEQCGLCEGRQAAVIAAEPVPPQADWLVVGDPPDAQEERDGVAFVGAAGQLLDNMLHAVQCRRDGQGRGGARLTNVVKCRPAVARNPQPDELAQCAVYLRREIALTQPRVILAMGRFAAMSLLSGSEPSLLQQPFGQLRGRVYRYAGVPVVVTYPPAKLLRAPLDKALAWADLCLARSLVEQAGSRASTL